MTPDELATTCAWPTETNCSVMVGLMVRVHVHKIDKLWQKGGMNYIPRGECGGDWCARSRLMVMHALANDKPIQAPIFTIDEPVHLRIIDGKRRFALLRDMGVNFMDMATNNISMKRAVDLCLIESRVFDVPATIGN